MQQHEGSLSKGRFSPRCSVCSAYIGQVDSLLILPCPQQVFCLLIQCNRLEQHYLYTSKPGVDTITCTSFKQNKEVAEDLAVHILRGYIMSAMLC